MTMFRFSVPLLVCMSLASPRLSATTFSGSRFHVPRPCGDSSLSPVQDVPAKTAHGEGIVTKVEPAGRLVIDGPIDGVMDAMVMKYKVRPIALLADVKAGDKVEFRVDRSYTIVDLSIVSHRH